MMKNINIVVILNVYYSLIWVLIAGMHFRYFVWLEVKESRIDERVNTLYVLQLVKRLR